MPSNPSDDRNQISLEKHELDYLLDKWNKSASIANREILARYVRQFKADPAWTPHNRERFYEFVAAMGVKSRLADKEKTTSPTTVLRENAQYDHPYTVIRNWSPPQPPETSIIPPSTISQPSPPETTTTPPSPPPPPPLKTAETPSPTTTTVFSSTDSSITPPSSAAPRPKEKKKTLIPLLLILAGLVAAGLLIFVLVFNKPSATAPAVTKTETTPPAEQTRASMIRRLTQAVGENTPVFFIGDQEFMLPGEEKKLDAIITSMTVLKKIDLTVTGHTADAGLPGPQSILSQERALTVKDYLAKNAGETELTIATVGKGATEPLIKDVPLYAQEKNRRVEITVNSAE